MPSPDTPVYREFIATVVNNKIGYTMAAIAEKKQITANFI